MNIYTLFKKHLFLEMWRKEPLFYLYFDFGNPSLKRDNQWESFSCESNLANQFLLYFWVSSIIETSVEMRKSTIVSGFKLSPSPTSPWLLQRISHKWEDVINLELGWTLLVKNTLRFYIDYTSHWVQLCFVILCIFTLHKFLPHLEVSHQ